MDDVLAQGGEEMSLAVNEALVQTLPARGANPAAGPIPGAVNIPLDQLSDRLSELLDSVEVVAYCRGAFCVLAHDAVRLLTRRGRLARRLEDGLLEWRLAALPVHAVA
jgi:hypothetical protein